MAKEVVNPRKIKSSLRPFKDFPLSAKEIKELEEIQDKQYWARRPLKEQFCDRNNRLVTEVDDYFKKNQRPPLGGGQRGIVKKKKDRFPIIPAGSIPAPREQVVTPEQTNHTSLSSTGEIRVKFKSIRIENDEIIFIV